MGLSGVTLADAAQYRTLCDLYDGIVPDTAFTAVSGDKPLHEETGNLH